MSSIPTPDELARLTFIGFNSLVARSLAATAVRGSVRRVCAFHGDHALIHDGSASSKARMLPALLRSLVDTGARVVVGDWVIANADAHGDWWMHERLVPFTELRRIAPGGARQALVSNVDCAFLVMGLDGDFNLRRLERYLALVKASGVLPVVVLTKADLCPDVDEKLDELRQRIPSAVDRHALNATDSRQLDVFAPYLVPGQTVVLLGSSGAGKSTLTNSLCGSSLMTGPVREDDSHGRHTTTTRTLHLLKGGACVIDTPGLRGLRLDIDAGAVQELFEDIDALAARCRFRDCRHESEPGCAVREAVAPDRLMNYHKLLREVARENADAAARRASKAHAKAMERAGRAHYRLNPGKK
jgi:ribosome biogenesis GTPase / thiamine phosphate phosphatase